MMRSKAARALALAISLLASTTVALADPPRVTRLPAISPGALNVPRTVAIPRPDFEVSQITPTLLWPQQRITGVTVTITDRCNGVASGAPYVDVVVTDPANPSNYVHMGYNAVGFVNGAHTDTQTVQTPASSVLPQTSTIRVTINASKQVLEAWSGNNSRQINPNISPFPAGKDYCLAENYDQ